MQGGDQTINKFPGANRGTARTSIPRATTSGAARVHDPKKAAAVPHFADNEGFPFDPLDYLHLVLTGEWPDAVNVPFHSPELTAQGDRNHVA